MHPARLPEEELIKQCTFAKGRGSGPGGQHRNKVETKVTVTHVPTGVETHASERRSAVENRRVAIRRLRLALAVKARSGVGSGDVRSELWRSRCSPEGRVSCNTEHADYPALLAEALDMVAACGLDVKKAAIRLSCSASQLIKLIQQHPAAIEDLNRQRAAAGEHPLH
jgi:protein subunit release factor A